jgi:hypothetical protein
MLRVLFIIALTGNLLMGSSTGDSIYRTGDTIRINAADTVKGDLFFGGRRLIADAVITSDVIAGGQQITINNDVGDDVYAAGEEVEINKTVNGGVIAMAKKVVIKGIVRGDVRAMGGFVYIEPGSIIEGDLYVGCGELTIDQAVIKGKVSGGAEIANLNGSFEKAVFIETIKPVFGENFSNNASFKLILNRQPDGPFANQPSNLEIEIHPRPMFFQKTAFWWLLVSAFVIGALLIGIFRSFHDDLNAAGVSKFGINLGIGAAFVIGFPLLAVFTLLFFPLGLILAALYAIVLYMSKIFASFIVGNWLSIKVFKMANPNPYLSFAIALLLISLLLQVPVLGFVLCIGYLILGSGSFLKYVWQLKKT